MDEQGNPSLSLQDYEMYFAGKLIRSNSKPVVLDRLGSVHAWIDAQNNVEKTTYYPFGEERQVTNQNRRKFGTYKRDAFSGLDYAEQRYYSSALGRFITPDPYEGSVRLRKPETWNRYAYVENDPVNHIDPHGLSICGVNGSPQYVVSSPKRADGTYAGGSSFTWNPTFKTGGVDPFTQQPYDPTCCMVTQMVQWDRDPAPIPFPGVQPNTWVIDAEIIIDKKSGKPKRVEYGSSRSACFPNDCYPTDTRFSGSDIPGPVSGSPSPPNGYTLSFYFYVYDTCSNPPNDIRHTSNMIQIRWP
jgi:RHS repeat-associated protein